MTSSNTMLRERVSTQGIVRALEPEEELTAFSVASERVGIVPDVAISRYLTAKENVDRKFERAHARIRKARERAVVDASHTTFAQMTRLQHYLTFTVCLAARLPALLCAPAA